MVELKMDEAMLALQWTNWRKSTTTEENELTRWSLKFQRVTAKPS